jgi:hypothetical protein
MGALFKMPGGPQFMTAAALQAQGRPVPDALSTSMMQGFGRPAQPNTGTAPPPAFSFQRNRTPGFGSRATLAAGATGTPYSGQTLGGGR